MVFTRDYQFENDRLTLFLITDKWGGAFADWLVESSDAEKAGGKATGLPFDEGYCLMVANNYFATLSPGSRTASSLGW